MSTNKEAVVFLLDVSPSMNTPYPAASSVNNDDDKPTTRLSCAKQAMKEMIADLMLKGKSNECMVLLLKSKGTRHHLCCAEDVEDGTAKYKHITELSPEDAAEKGPGSGPIVAFGIQRPTIDLLRALRRVEVVEEEVYQGMSREGNFCDGLAVAADALYRRTFRKPNTFLKFKRRIVIFTDAVHEADISNWEQMNRMIASLRRLDCKLEVIGLDFSESAEFDAPLAVTSNSNIEESTKDADQTAKMTDKDYKDLVKSENEKLLIGLSRLTSGTVAAASSMQQILKSMRGKRIPTSVSRKCEFRITSTLVVAARISLFCTKSRIPTLKKKIIMVDEKGRTKRSSDGREQTSDIKPCRTFWESVAIDSNEIVEVDETKRAKAFRYGSTLIPFGENDWAGLKTSATPSISILGFLRNDQIPPYARFGPVRCVVGDPSSRRACTAISALSLSLFELGQVGIVRYVSAKDADPKLAAVFPSKKWSNHRKGDACRLFLCGLPFADDKVRLKLSSLSRNRVSEDQMATCSEMIESFMLPEDSIRYNEIPCPCLRSINKTVMDRAVDPSALDIKHPRLAGPNDDPMAVPSEVLRRAENGLEKFMMMFPRKKTETE